MVLLFQKEVQDFIQLTACQGKIDTSPFLDLNFMLLSVKTQSNIRKDKCMFSFFFFFNSQVNLLNSIHDNFHQ